MLSGPPLAAGRLAKGEAERLLDRLEWTVVRRLDGLLQGDYRTLFHGQGLDLAELREYQFTDDVRYIDWNVTARLQTPYVRQYREDRDVTAWFLLDLSPSIDFGTAQALKRDVLVEFVSLLARLLTRRGNRVAAVLYSGGVDSVLPPGSGRTHALRLVRMLLKRPRLRRAPATDLGVLLERGLAVARRRALVFVVSDFMSRPGWERPLGMLAQRHEVLGVRLQDPREMELPDIGPVVMEDAETGEQVWVNTRDKGFRRRFGEIAQRRRAEALAALSRAGAPLLELSTEGDLVAEVLRFASIRKRIHGRPHPSAAVSRPSTLGQAASGRRREKG